jgi:hypothetical protein
MSDAIVPNNGDDDVTMTDVDNTISVDANIDQVVPQTKKQYRPRPGDRFLEFFLQLWRNTNKGIKVEATPIGENIFKYLSGNPNIYSYHLVENPEFPWDYNKFSQNLNLSLDFVIDNIDKDWSSDIYENPDISAKQYKDFVVKMVEFLKVEQMCFGKYDGCAISKQLCGCIDKKKVDKIGWLLRRIPHLYDNPNMTKKDMEEIKEILSTVDIKIEWDFNARHPAFDFELNAQSWGINLNSYSLLSRNPRLVLDYVIANKNKPWLWTTVICNPNIIPQEIFDHPEMNWPYRLLAFNPNMTIDFVERKFEKYQDKGFFGNSYHKLISLEFFREFCLKKLGREYFSREIPLQSIIENPITDDYETIKLIIEYANTLRTEDPKFEPINDLKSVIKDSNLTIALNPKFTLSQNWEMNRRREKIFIVKLATFEMTRSRVFLSPNYRLEMTKKIHKRIYPELIVQACHPRRSVFSWNEGAIEEMPEAYKMICDWWKKIKVLSDLHKYQPELKKIELTWMR